MSAQPTPRVVGGTQNKRIEPDTGRGSRIEDRPAGAGPGSAEEVQSGAERLLQFETTLRDLQTESELRFHLVNELRRVVPYRQAMLIERNPKPRVTTVSSLSVVDRNAPMVRWIESLVRAMAQDSDIGEPHDFVLPAYSDADPEQAKAYPFPYLLWVPLKDRHGRVFAGVLLAQEHPRRAQDVTIASHVAASYAYVWQALGGARVGLRKRLFPARRLWPLALLALVAAGFIPVPMSTLAPAEIVADDPVVIAAPLSGVIDRIEVEPNTRVVEGQVLFTFVETELRNELEVAEKQLLVADAANRKATQSAFVDPRAKRELAITAAELALKRTERDYARDLLERTQVRASAAGLVIFSDPDDWTGRPVTTGERVMEIADPNRVQLRVELDVEDSISLEEGAETRLFLDADPLNPLRAQVSYAAHKAEPTPDGRLAYRVDAELSADGETPLRIGLRGTAQIFGDDVPLYFYLLRRPISALRQTVGF